MPEAFVLVKKETQTVSGVYVPVAPAGPGDVVSAPDPRIFTLLPIPEDIPAAFANARCRPDGATWEVYFDTAKRDTAHRSMLRFIRDRRNHLLTNTDWRVTTDSPLSAEDSAAWRAYRTALRQLPQTCDPMNPEWPVAPDGSS